MQREGSFSGVGDRGQVRWRTGFEQAIGIGIGDGRGDGGQRGRIGRKEEDEERESRTSSGRWQPQTRYGLHAALVGGLGPGDAARLSRTSRRQR